MAEPGFSAVLIAGALGARVVAVDVDPAALALAARIGAHSTLNSTGLSPTEVGAEVQARTGGGARISVDAIGHRDVVEASVRGLRRRGRHVQVGLLLGGAAMTPLPMDLIVARELEVYGSHGMAAADYPPMLDLAARLDLEQLIGRVITLDEAPQALAAMSEPAVSPGVTVISLA